MIQRIEVEIPEGWEFDGYRIPESRDYYLRETGKVCGVDWEFYTPCICLRKAWYWPKWLKVPWIAMDKDGRWHGYNAEPSIGQGCHRIWSEGANYRTILLTGNFAIDFDPPPCDDWTKSKRKNPHYV